MSPVGALVGGEGRGLDRPGAGDLGPAEAMPPGCQHGGQDMRARARLPFRTGAGNLETIGPLVDDHAFGRGVLDRRGQEVVIDGEDLDASRREQTLGFVPDLGGEDFRKRLDHWTFQTVARTLGIRPV